MKNRLISNLLQQDVYVRCACVCKDVDMSCSPSEYLDCQYKSGDSGLDYVVKKESYPITPDYVNSFSDPSSVIAQKQALLNDPESLQHVKPGLDNLVAIQELLEMDSSEVASRLSELKQKYLDFVEKKEEMKLEGEKHE